MLFTSVGDDIDIDILSSLWPKNWSAAQLLLNEEGFSDEKSIIFAYVERVKK